MLRFIVNGIDSKFIPEFMRGLNERTSTYLAAPSAEAVMAADAVNAVDAWISEWLISAALLKRRSFMSAAASPTDDTTMSGDELRQRVRAKRAAAVLI